MSKSRSAPLTRLVEMTFTLGHFAVIVMFMLCALGLLALAATELWHAFTPAPDVERRSRFSAVLETVGMLTIALVAIDLAQTVFEESVQRDVKVSGPTRVRRFLSRFMVVIIVALSIETLVAVFELLHEDPAHLPYAGVIGGSAALLLIGWGVFIRLNRSAEELEPEAMEEVKDEDRSVEDAADGQRPQSHVSDRPDRQDAAPRE